MRLLAQAPTEKHLQRLYYELAKVGAPSVGRRSSWPYRPQSTEDLLILGAEMVRYDARLLSVLLQFVVENEASLNPRTLRAGMEQMRWPQSMLVVFEFARSSTQDSEVRYMGDYLAMGISRVQPAELFFIDSQRPGSRIARRRIGRNLVAYAKWGFIGTERPTADVFRKKSVGRYDAPTRRQIGQSLADRHGSFSLSRYLDAIDHSVSRAQARDDLRKAGLRLRGKGRGARWSK